MFYNGFENRGFSPNIGENYPFQFQFLLSPANRLPQSRQSPFPGAPRRARRNRQRLKLASRALRSIHCWSTPTVCGLLGIQFNYSTPYTMSGNLTVQYQLAPSMSIQVGYVNSLARHLEVVSELPPTPFLRVARQRNAQHFIPFPDFGRNPSYAATAGRATTTAFKPSSKNSSQNGLNFLFTYTFSKTLTDADDLLNGGSSRNVSVFRAPSVPGLGMPF